MLEGLDQEDFGVVGQRHENRANHRRITVLKQQNLTICSAMNTNGSSACENEVIDINYIQCNPSSLLCISCITALIHHSLRTSFCILIKLFLH